MADRRPIAISMVILTIAVVLFAVTFIGGPLGISRNSEGLSQGSGTKGSGSRNESVMERGSINATSKLPQDIELLDVSADGTLTGKVLCGNCTYKTGDACNVMIYDEAAKHMVTVLPNENYNELESLIGST